MTTTHPNQFIARIVADYHLYLPGAPGAGRNTAVDVGVGVLWDSVRNGFHAINAGTFVWPVVEKFRQTGPAAARLVALPRVELVRPIVGANVTLVSTPTTAAFSRFQPRLLVSHLGETKAVLYWLALFSTPRGKDKYSTVGFVVAHHSIIRNEDRPFWQPT